MTTSTFTVYTLSPKGAFSKKYEGTEYEAAERVFKKLASKQQPRCLNIREDTGEQRMLTWGMSQ